ncbi:lysylphosphatidylglycerol synthase transmembrane domain-containing protein [Fibrella sp. ES10-3-2-2]|nr:hypothetical protein A6C57_08760 [Fibrella sp. ES10-3-2-2]
MNRLVKKIAPLLLAFLLLAYALKGVSFQEISEQFRRSDYTYIFLYILSTLAFYVARGIRWRQALFGLGYQPTGVRATVALMTGTVASLIFPGAGELTRCGTLLRTDGVPLAQGLGSVVAERMIDLLMLLILIALTLLFEFDRMVTYLNGVRLPAYGGTKNGWIIVLVVIMASSVCLLLMINRSTAIVQQVYKRVVQLLRGLWKGFLSIRNLPNPVVFIIATFFVQLLAWGSVYLLLLAVSTGANLTPGTALMILTVSSVGGLAVPTQAGIGTYHFLVSRTLVLYGFSVSEGIVLATFMHAVGFAINLLLSSISFLLVPFLVTRHQKTAEPV